MEFNKWLDTLIEEKEIDTQMGMQIEGASNRNLSGIKQGEKSPYERDT